MTNSSDSMNVTQHPIECHVEHVFDEATSLREEWDSLILRIQGRLYQTWDWCNIWWDHYGKDRELHLLTFRRGGVLVAVVPMFIERLVTWPIRLTIAKLLSSDFTMVICDPAVDPDYALDVFQLVLKHLVGTEHCDAVHFGPLSGAYKGLTPLRAACAARPALALIGRDRVCGSHTEFNLTDGFDAYLKGLDKRQRGNYRTNLNGLTKAFRFHVDTVTNAGEGRREFIRFMQMHKTQWNAMNKLGHFGDWPGSAEFHLDLVYELATRGQLRLMRLMIDDEPAAYNLCLALNGVYYWRMPARNVGREWDRYALGRVSLLKMLEAAANDGALQVEAGVGSYDYKEKLNAVTHPLHSIVAVANQTSARARTKWTLLGADILHKIYYKGWYLRVAPKLARRRRSLSVHWIRRRFG